jgi:hypothetical protein
MDGTNWALGADQAILPKKSPLSFNSIPAKSCHNHNALLIPLSYDATTSSIGIEQ